MPRTVIAFASLISLSGIDVALHSCAAAGRVETSCWKERGTSLEGHREEWTMVRIARRRLLQLSGAGAVAASTGGIAAILATGRAPAYAQATTLHWLRWSDFVPASDQLLRSQIVPQCEKELGVKLTL